MSPQNLEAAGALAAFASLACLLASIGWPWLARSRGRGYQAGRTAALAAIATALFVLAQLCWRVFQRRADDIPVDLVICPPMFLVAWVQSAVVAFVQVQASSRRPPTNDDRDL